VSGQRLPDARNQQIFALQQVTAQDDQGWIGCSGAA
jgi:hypothetical protein